MLAILRLLLPMGDFFKFYLIHKENIKQVN